MSWQVEPWQYLVLEYSVSLQPKAEQRRAELAALELRCNELGAQGWELASMAPLACTLGGGGLTSQVRLIFKRRAACSRGRGMGGGALGRTADDARPNAAGE